MDNYTGALSEDEMLSLFDSDPDMACAIVKDAAQDLVAYVEEGQVQDILDEHQKTLYCMARVILYLYKLPTPTKGGLH